LSPAKVASTLECDAVCAAKGVQRDVISIATLVEPGD
jgi:hypothetical protein